MHWTSCVQWSTNGQCLDFTALWNIKKQHHRVSALKYSCMRNIELYKPSPQWKVTVSKLKEDEESAQTGWLLREQTRFADLLRWRFYTCIITNIQGQGWEKYNSSHQKRWQFLSCAEEIWINKKLFNKHIFQLCVFDIAILHTIWRFWRPGIVFRKDYKYLRLQCNTTCIIVLAEKYESSKETVIKQLENKHSMVH